MGLFGRIVSDDRRIINEIILRGVKKSYGGHIRIAK